MASRPFVQPQIIDLDSYESECIRNGRSLRIIGSNQYPLINDIYEIVPLPFIHYVPIPCGADLASDSLRLVRNVTESPPVFSTLPLQHTLPDTANIQEDFVAAMRTKAPTRPPKAPGHPLASPARIRPRQAQKPLRPKSSPLLGVGRGFWAQIWALIIKSQ
ncbi:hypothetical protein DFH28DRAFT_938977 [Melampsora americana]|nr:hypothetical protein DFH28DRAFT_938977 [Melampsora americana]